METTQEKAILARIKWINMNISAHLQKMRDWPSIHGNVQRKEIIRKLEHERAALLEKIN